MAILEKSMKTALDTALNEILKDWKWKTEDRFYRYPPSFFVMPRQVRFLWIDAPWCFKMLWGVHLRYARLPKCNTSWICERPRQNAIGQHSLTVPEICPPSKKGYYNFRLQFRTILLRFSRRLDVRKCGDESKWFLGRPLFVLHILNQVGGLTSQQATYFINVL